MNPLIQLKKATPLFLIVVLLACFALSQRAQAVVPPPDGGYPGFNTAEGQNALFSLTTGAANTAVGWFSLFSNAENSFNTATGAGALLFNTADENTAFGAAALLFNTDGAANTAVGAAALLNNTTGSTNTAIGDAALRDNTTGSSNTATGLGALLFNTTGIENTANGVSALRNTTGSANTANGRSALFNNTTGDFNTSLGYRAGINLTTGDNNVCIGASVEGVAGESNTTRIRNIYASVANGRVVYVNSDDKIGTLASSRRYKDEIKPMEKASEVLFALKPVTYRYKKEFDAGRTPMFGLIAEDVEQVDPDLVSRNEKGEVDTVRYEQINAMLLNEFLKEHRKGEEQGKTIAELKSAIAQQEKQIKALTAGLEKVSAQLEMNGAPRVVENTY
jgi:hypothetical protein